MKAAQLSSKWVLVLTLGVVMASFLSATMYAEHRADRTHALTAEIASNDSPSIMHLAAARAELRDLQRLLTTHVLLASTGRLASSGADSAAAVAAVRDRLRSDLESYFALPTSPGERELWDRMNGELADVDRLSRRILNAVAGGNVPLAQYLSVQVLPTEVEQEADAIMTAIQLNAAAVRRIAEEIDGERRTRALWVFGLDGISVVLASLLGFLVFRMASRQEEMNRRRSEELEGFAGRVAHDLLNPLSAAEMGLALVERSPIDDERRRAALARARRSLERARRLIDDLLAFAQAGAKPAADGVAATVNDVVDGVIEELRPPAAARGIRVSAELPTSTIYVRCAPGVLGSLLGNLVRNAIKHMHSDENRRREVQIRVLRRRALQARTELDDVIRFEVQDTGPGLPPGLVARAFDPYVRGAGTREPGLGLGLATVRRLVEGHGGRYGVQSRAGEGALFWFELPIAPAPPPGAAITADEAPARSRQAAPIREARAEATSWKSPPV